MSSPIISVESLSKAYRIGVADEKHDTLAATVASWVKSPFRNLKRLSSLNVSGEQRDSSGESDSGRHSPLATRHSSLAARHSDIHWALRDVSFDVQEGEVVGIIGRNGAGKSTLLKVLSRITDPTSGRAVIRGRVSSLLEVGTGFHPELSGRDNIYMNGTILGMRKKEIDRKFDQIVEFSGVEKFIDTPVKRYSSGMKVRLAFAVAAHLEPEILIIDEVLAVGDQEFQDRCIGKMGEVSRSGRTVLFVSHNMAAVQALCTRGICIVSGRVEVDGSVDDVLERYQKSMYQSRLSEVPLCDVPRSNRNSIPLMQAARLIDNSGHPTTRFPICGTFRLDVDFSCPEKPMRPVLGVRVRTSSGSPVFGIDNRMMKEFQFDREVSAGTIEFRIDSLPLMPGLYQADLWLGDAFRSLDAIENAVSFEVYETDVTGTGKLPPAVCGPVFQPARWVLTDRKSVASDHCVSSMPGIVK